MKKGYVHIYYGHSKGKTTTAIGMAVRAASQNWKVGIIQFLKGGAYTGELIFIRRFLPNVEIFQYGKPCIKEREQLSLDKFDNDIKKAIEDQGINYVREDIVCGECRYCFVNDEEMRDYCNKAFEHAKKMLSEDYDLVVLDEINVAIQLKFLQEDDVLEILKGRNPKTEVVLTGRGRHEKLIEYADMVSEIKPVKHYFNKGVMARRGVEY
jgi:cob(I)alamin adenosyltransferase